MPTVRFCENRDRPVTRTVFAGLKYDFKNKRTDSYGRKIRFNAVIFGGLKIKIVIVSVVFILRRQSAFFSAIDPSPRACHTYVRLTC